MRIKRAACQQGSSVIQQPSFANILSSYDPNTNITSHELTKFELAQVVGLRMEQLARNAPAFVEVDDIIKHDVPLNDKLMQIAMRELLEKKMPFMLCRTLPGGDKEYWRLCDMMVPNILPIT
jgi:DNA-directed RNA polymerase subunit K/omega